MSDDLGPHEIRARLSGGFLDGETRAARGKKVIARHLQKGWGVWNMTDEEDDDGRVIFEYAPNEAPLHLKRCLNRVAGYVRYADGDTHLTDDDMQPVCPVSKDPHNWRYAKRFDPETNEDPDEHADVVSALTCPECRGILGQ